MKTKQEAVQSLALVRSAQADPNDALTADCLKVGQAALQLDVLREEYAQLVREERSKKLPYFVASTVLQVVTYLLLPKIFLNLGQSYAFLISQVIFWIAYGLNIKKLRPTRERLEANEAEQKILTQKLLAD